MRALALALLVVAGGAQATEPRARCAACSLMPAGATGSDLTLSGILTADSILLTGASSAGSTINMTSSNSNVYCNSASALCAYITGISAAAAGATPATAAFKFYTTQALDATDYVFSVGNQSDGTSLFNVAYNGDVSANNNIKAAGVLRFGGQTVGGITTGTIAGGGNGNGSFYQSNAADAVAGSQHRFVGANAFTSGVDRYIADFFLDNAVTAKARIFSDGTYQNLATVGTAASGTGVTANYSGAVRTFLHKVTVTSAAMTAAATTDITIALTPTNSAVRRMKADVITKFIGGALTAVTLVCGNAAGGNQYLLSGDIFTNPIVLGDGFAEVGAGVAPATWADFGTAAAGTNGAITVQCRFTCTTANCNAATQGSVTFYVEGVTY